MITRPISLALARAILGEENYFGIEEWDTRCDVQLIKEKLPSRVKTFPWGEEILTAPCPFTPGKKICETHFAFLGLDTVDARPLTIMHLRERYASRQPRFSFDEEPWYEDQRFATHYTCETRWHLMLKDCVPHSPKKRFDEQLLLLPAGYEVPGAIEETLKLLLYYELNGAYCNSHISVRCVDRCAPDRFAIVGNFDYSGLYVGDCWDKGRYLGVGIGASLLSPNVS